MTSVSAADVLANTDCEAYHGGVVAQPVNTITSLGFVVVGLGLVIRGLRRRRADHADLIYGTTLMAIGLGSAAFHGPQPRGAQMAHDIPIYAAIYYILLHNLHDLGYLKRVDRTFFLGLAPIALLGSTPVMGPVVGVVLAISAMASELLRFRSRPPNSDPRERDQEFAMASVMVVAGAAYFLGRTGSALCDPDSPLQLHGLWHLLSAAAFAMWGIFTLDELDEKVDS